MSLIGSLEDLGLGDILQIISLSQKSGVLVIRSEHGEGRVVLRDGLVRAACYKDGPRDLCELLVREELLSADDFEAAADAARHQGITVEEAIAANTAVELERIETLRRESVETAVIAMFAWRSGEFSFDVRTELEAEDPQLLLPGGINAQYLAMEGSRIEDESGRLEPGEGFAEDDTEVADLDAHAMFGVANDDPEPEPEPDPPDEQSAAEAVAVAAVQQAELTTEDISEVEPAIQEEAGPLIEAEPVAEAEAEGAAPPPAPAAVPTGPAGPPLVVIDPDLLALEWMKSVLVERFSRVHIFQRWDLGLARIRQYLARVQFPVVKVQPNVPGDPLSGIRNPLDLVGRLKSQQPRMRVLWIQVEGAEVIGDRGQADGVVARPATTQLRAARGAEQLADLADDLVNGLMAHVAEGAEAPARPSGPSAASGDELRRLREATALLSDASTRGEVLPLVIRFAGEIFTRVAMLMVRGDRVVGMAQSNLALAGGPDDEGLREVSVDPSGSSWLRTVIERRQAVCCAPGNAGDIKLAALLGDRAPGRAYLAPIESAGEVVAVLYADDLPNEGPEAPNTEALEVVLHHAGLALDRAVLERALAEAEGD